MVKASDIPSNPRFCLRLSPEERKQFEEAAERDGKALGTWLKWLARKRDEKTGRTDL